MSPANRKIFMAGSLNLIDFGALDILICVCVCIEWKKQGNERGVYFEQD